MHKYIDRLIGKVSTVLIVSISSIGYASGEITHYVMIIEYYFLLWTKYLNKF